VNTQNPCQGSVCPEQHKASATWVSKEAARACTGISSPDAVVPGSLIGVITMVRDERRSEPGTLEL